MNQFHMCVSHPRQRLLVTICIRYGENNLSIATNNFISDLRTGEISGPHGGDYEDACLLGCSAV
jgi:hypothetical protein